MPESSVDKWIRFRKKAEIDQVKKKMKKKGSSDERLANVGF